MTSNLFSTYLLASSYRAVEFARTYVHEPLTFDFLYDVELNQSCDVRYSEPEFHLYPDEYPLSYRHISMDEAVKLLCRDGYVPVWIDINVKSIRRKKTVIELFCAGRYSNRPEEYYYEERGAGPFGVKSPYLPYLVNQREYRFWLCKNPFKYLYLRFFVKG